MSLETASIGDALRIIIDGKGKLFIIERVNEKTIRCSNIDKKDTPALLSISLFKNATSNG